MRGPKRSSTMPTTMRAGTVSATLQMAMVRICGSLRPRSALMAVAKGAKLNQTTNDKKKANHVRCRILYLPPNDHIPAIAP